MGMRKITNGKNGKRNCPQHFFLIFLDGSIQKTFLIWFVKEGNETCKVLDRDDNVTL